MKEVKVRYFAVFREITGISAENVKTSASSLSGLYKELADRYGFQLTTQEVKASLNRSWVSLDSDFQSGAEVVFIPPVAGG
jgi:molybdopterin converting factor small subunit